MAVIAHPSLTNSQPIGVRPWAGERRHVLARLGETLSLWHRRIRERRALARMAPHELADFGATTADVYRELNTPFWRSLPPC